jgi:hypothetical protein
LCGFNDTAAPPPRNEGSFIYPNFFPGQDNNPDSVGSYPSIGKNDLYPPLPSIGQNPPDWFNGQGGGSMVGPDHPVFGGVGQLPHAPGFEPGMPFPRFDPLTPFIPDRGGRGRAGRGASRIPGEPNPDHLRPPKFDDNDII